VQHAVTSLATDERLTRNDALPYEGGQWSMARTNNSYHPCVKMCFQSSSTKHSFNQRSASPFTSIEVAQLHNHFTSQLPRKSKQQTLPRWHVLLPPLCLAYATERRTLRGQPGLATASRQRRDTPSRAVDSSAKQSYSCAVACRAGDDVARRHTSRIDLLDRYFTQ